MMVLVGLSLLVVYGLAALSTVWLFALLWVNRPPLGTTVLVVAVLVLVFGYLSYQFGTTRILAGLDARELDPARAPGLYQAVDDLTRRMDVEPPRLLLAEMELPNALAVGTPANGAIVLDRSLVRLLTDDELLAIIAHECAHLESHDSLVQTLAYSVMRTVVGTVAFLLLPVLLLVVGFARAVAWLRGQPARWTETALGRFYGTVQGAVALLLFFLTVVVRAHSRRREFAADERAAEVTGRPLALARALKKIERVTDPHWGLLSTLYVRGDENEGLREVLATHPDVDDRVDRLVELARGEVG